MSCAGGKGRQGFKALGAFAIFLRDCEFPIPLPNFKCEHGDEVGENAATGCIGDEKSEFGYSPRCLVIQGRVFEDGKGGSVMKQPCSACDGGDRDDHHPKTRKNDPSNRDVRKVKKDEWVGRSSGKIKQPGQGRYIGQQQ